MPNGDPVDREAVGVVPAAGSGRRIAPLPCSKELYPIGFQRDERTGEPRAKVVSAHLLDRFESAGIRRAMFIVRSGKWDIPGYFLDGTRTGLALAYVVIDDSLGPPDTVDKAYAFIAGHDVAFGFPDIVCGPDDLFTQLRRQQVAAQAEIVLGLHPAQDCRVADMIETNGDGRVRQIVLKPASTELRYTWTCAVWTPAFTRFMHEFVAHERASGNRQSYGQIDPSGDLPMGAVVKAALDDGMRMHSVAFPDESYLDIGTPDNLVTATRGDYGTP